ncbi:MAG TPA: succinate dehydrogenase, cytochrome b556 subunit [Alphaproteobacteria bacterium]|nr:succinate dehydrogenase, cytochrome b556 subunit [Alphaproteobacteria bacterium]
MTARNRPLSPHLQIYRPQLTSVLSITHRASGVALALGTLLLVWWIAAVVRGPDSFALVQHFIASFIGRLLLFGWTWALFFHLANGVRHLAWDAGLGFDLESTTVSGWLAVAASAVLTLVTWLVGYVMLGAF